MKDYEEVLQEFKLRRLIRKAIRIRKHKTEKEENQLRCVIQTLLKEGDLDADTKPAPYESTPVNMLADAFNQILPVLKGGLRKLSKPEERESYRAHVLTKLQSIFDSFESLDSKAKGAIGESDLTEEDEGERPKNKINVEVDDPDRIIPDIEQKRFAPKKPDPEKELEDQFDEFSLTGKNPTGARVAFETINDSNIQSVLADKRKTLYDPDDKEQFKQYALYNADLWLLTYEKELADLLGQSPAFSEVEMPRPSGAQEAQIAQGFGAVEDDEGGLEEMEEFEKEPEEEFVV